MNNNILISIGMLQTFWEKNQQDTLDLLVPFLKCSIARTTKINGIIDINTITSDFRSEYGYDDIPLNVISVMLKRLSPSILRRERKKYILKTSLDKELSDFEKKRLINKEHQEKVISALKDHLEKFLPKADFSEEMVADSLFSFFASNGLYVAKDVERLIGLKQKDGRVEYEIARFIMNEYHKDSSVFSYLNELVTGFFVSTAISIEQAATSTKTKMRGLSCYIDTRIINNALGFHLPSETKTSAVEFFDMLKASGVKLYCFQHNYEEIVNVLTAYKMSISNPHKLWPGNTLESFDEKGYTVSDVESYISRLQYRIEELGIKIVDSPAYENVNYNSEAYIDYPGLKEALMAGMYYNPRSASSAADTDTKSAAAIMLLRNGNHAFELEKAQHLFVSSSDRYCSIVSKFLKTDGTGKVPVAFSELNLSSLLWLRNYSTHKDYPKSKLIENAMSILEMPSSAFLNGLFNVIERLESQGMISQDEAIILRQDYYIKKEILSEVRGDSSAVTDESVKSARDRLREKYSSDESKKADLNYQNYIHQKEENKKAIRNAEEVIQETGMSTFNTVKRRLSILTNVSMCLIAILAVAALVYGIADSTSWAFVAGAIVLILDIIGVIDSIREKRKTIQKWITQRARDSADKAMDMKREEYEKILGKLVDINRGNI